MTNPRHIAIIMDGNGRWAKARHLPRALGHKAGGDAVKRVVEACRTLDIECLTLYAFSSENWKRDAEEISDLMGLMRRFIEANLAEMVENGIRLKIIGDYKAFEPDIVAKLEDALARTAGGSRTLAVALNYGAQQEIVRAAALAAGEGEITPEAIERHLFTVDLPPLDLLIRTSGEERGRQGLDVMHWATEEHPAGRWAYAVVQLRQDNKLGTLWNMVGFQTKMKHGAQVELFRTIPGLQNAEFARLGGMHRRSVLARACMPGLPRLRRGCRGARRGRWGVLLLGDPSWGVEIDAGLNVAAKFAPVFIEACDYAADRLHLCFGIEHFR